MHIRVTKKIARKEGSLMRPDNKLFRQPPVVVPDHAWGRYPKRGGAAGIKRRTQLRALVQRSLVSEMTGSGLRMIDCVAVVDVRGLKAIVVLTDIAWVVVTFLARSMTAREEDVAGYIAMARTA